MQVRQLRFTVEAYVSSLELRSCCERNRNRVYISEWLLDAWDIPMAPNLRAQPDDRYVKYKPRLWGVISLVPLYSV